MKYGIEILISQQQNRKRVLSAKNKDQRLAWLKAIRRGARQFALEDYYTVGEQLGIGKFSSVRVCTHNASGKTYAVKIIDKAGIDDEEREALRTEIAVLQLVHHPHVIRLKNVFETKEKIFIVTELVKGGDLFDRIVKRRRFPESVARTLISQILEAIHYLHERGIVHRDLKPENIMLTSEESEDNVKIGDFGLSKFAVPEEIMKLPCGTLAYVAPEVLNMKGYGKEVDLWSVGVILFVLIRGRLPFDSKVRGEVIAKTLAGNLPIEGDPIWNNTSAECIDLVHRLLDPDRIKRLSVQEALRHPWITGRAATDLDDDDDESAWSSVHSELQLESRVGARNGQPSAIGSIVEEHLSDDLASNAETDSL
jgi:serine/threonine protein kinase